MLDRPVDYDEAWALQRALHARVVAGGAATVLLLEHVSVYTAGSRTQVEDRPPPTTEVAVIDVDRGGRITWHGPGQLVAYPIVPLPSPVDVVGHVRRLEQAVMDACSTFGLETARVDGRSGVWVEGTRKVAAIGVRVSRGVAMHGVAVNVSPDLSAFDLIVPCGLADAGVTSLSAELGTPVPLDEFAVALEQCLRDVLQPTLGDSYV